MPPQNEIPDELQPLIKGGIRIIQSHYGCNESGRVKFLGLLDEDISDISGVESLTELEWLDLTGNPIKTLDPIKHLKNLKILWVDSEHINNLDPLKELLNLKDLRIIRGQINSLESLRNLINLETLRIESSQINNIEPLKGLIKLTYLSINNNYINNIEPLSGLSELIELDLSSNHIISLEPIRQLGKIKNIYIHNNPCSKDIPAETISAGWQAIREWLNTRDNHVKIFEAKMLLLGNPNVGKSDLLYYLEHNKIKPKEDKRNPTHGLEYKELTSINKEWKIHCWDFGGQEYYHATHQLFFSPGALHLLLWSARNVQRIENLQDTFFSPDYWLRCIEQLSQGEGNIETISIENKIDIELTYEERTEQKNTYRLLNREEYTKEYPNLELNMAKISLQDCKRLEGLIEIVKERLSTLFRKHPPKYATLLSDIQRSKKSVLTIAQIAGQQDHEYVKTAMTVLHNIGCVLYFKDVISEKVFVKPKALLDLLYEHILNEEKTKSISLNRLEEVIKGNELGLSVNEVKDLLMSFHLVFTIPDKSDEYYIPQYLPAEPSWMELLGRLHFRMSYVRIVSDVYIMHNALMRIFTEYGRCIKKGEGDSTLFWKDGLVIEKDGKVLLIKFNRKEQSIDLYNDLEDANLELQKEIITFVVNIKTDKRHSKNTSNSNNNLDVETKILSNTEVWDSKYFDVMVSSDGKYFASLRDVVANIDNKSYNVEARNNSGNKKYVSVFDFNKYLPNNKQGKMRKIFISYSKTDLELVNNFIEHLSALKLDGKVATWFCTELTPGSTWNAEIQEHFDEADMICFMISPNFMRTKYIHDHEIDRAFKKRMKDSKNGKNILLVPIILDFCRWKTDKNDLTQFTALPFTAKPVVDFHNQNMAWYLVEECLRLIIEKNEQPTGDDYFTANLPEDVKRLYERIVKGEENPK